MSEVRDLRFSVSLGQGDEVLLADKVRTPYRRWPARIRYLIKKGFEAEQRHLKYLHIDDVDEHLKIQGQARFTLAVPYDDKEIFKLLSMAQNRSDEVRRLAQKGLLVEYSERIRLDRTSSVTPTTKTPAKAEAHNKMRSMVQGLAKATGS